MRQMLLEDGAHGGEREKDTLRSARLTLREEDTAKMT